MVLKMARALRAPSVASIIKLNAAAPLRIKAYALVAKWSGLLLLVQGSSSSLLNARCSRRTIWGRGMFGDEYGCATNSNGQTVGLGQHVATALLCGNALLEAGLRHLLAGTRFSVAERGRSGDSLRQLTQHQLSTSSMPVDLPSKQSRLLKMLRDNTPQLTLWPLPRALTLTWSSLRSPPGLIVSVSPREVVRC